MRFYISFERIDHSSSLVRIAVYEVEDCPEIGVVLGIHVGAGLGILVVYHAVVAKLPVAVRGREADSSESVPWIKGQIQGGPSPRGLGYADSKFAVAFCY